MNPLEKRFGHPLEKRYGYPLEKRMQTVNVFQSKNKQLNPLQKREALEKGSRSYTYNEKKEMGLDGWAAGSWWCKRGPPK